MHRAMISAALLSAVGCLAEPFGMGTVSAEVSADPTELDLRIREFLFEPNQVFAIRGAPGFVQSIVFDPGEVIVSVEIGDSETWNTEVHRTGDRISIKPVGPSEVLTNLLITTDRHTYAFVLSVLEPETVEAFRYQFTYPKVDEPALVRSSLSAFHMGQSGGKLITRDYAAAGDPILTPVTAFDDGEKTYIQLSRLATRAAVFELVDGKERLVNSRDLEDGTIVLDGVYAQLSIRDGAHYACLFNVPLYNFVNAVR